MLICVYESAETIPAYTETESQVFGIRIRMYISNQVMAEIFPLSRRTLPQFNSNSLTGSLYCQTGTRVQVRFTGDVTGGGEWTWNSNCAHMDENG